MLITSNNSSISRGVANSDSQRYFFFSKNVFFYTMMYIHTCPIIIITFAEIFTDASEVTKQHEK